MSILRDQQVRKHWVSQEKYIEKVLQRFNMKDVKPAGVLLGSHFKLRKVDLSENEMKIIE